MLEVKENVSLDPSRVTDPTIIDPNNYAADPDVCDRVKTKIIPLVQRTRTQRAGLEQFWQRMYMVWAVQNDVNTRLYSGMADQYLPSGNNAIETLIAHVKSEIYGMPGTPVAVKPNPLDPFAQITAPIVQMLMQRNFEQAEVQAMSDIWFRQAYLFGSSPSKVVWKTIKMIGAKPGITGLDPLTQTPVLGIVPNPVTIYEGPTFVPVNLLKWYIYPYNVQRLRDARMCFEDTKRSIEEFNAAGTPDESGETQWFNVPLALEQKPVTTSDITQTQGFLDARTSLFGLFDSQIYDEDLITTTEIYTLFDPKGDGQNKLCKITICGNVCLEIRQAPFIDPTPPYVVLKFKPIMEHFYGRSKIQNIESMNLAQNAAFNQGIDSNMFAGNPLTGINATTLQGRVEDFEITPMGIYLFNGEPQKQMTFYEIPNTFPANMQLVTNFQDMIDRTTQTPPILSGEVPSADNVTATATNAAAMGASVGVSEDAMAIKLALREYLRKAWKLTQQYLSTQASIALTHGPVINVDPSVLVGDCDWDFVTGSEAMNLINQQNAAMAQAQMMQQSQGGIKGAGISSQTLRWPRSE
jgi:hypothetical protein